MVPHTAQCFTKLRRAMGTTLTVSAMLLAGPAGLARADVDTGGEDSATNDGQSDVSSGQQPTATVSGTSHMDPAVRAIVSAAPLGSAQKTSAEHLREASLEHLIGEAAKLQASDHRQEIESLADALATLKGRNTPPPCFTCDPDDD